MKRGVAGVTFIVVGGALVVWLEVTCDHRMQPLRRSHGCFLTFYWHMSMHEGTPSMPNWRRSTHPPMQSVITTGSGNNANWALGPESMAATRFNFFPLDCPVTIVATSVQSCDPKPNWAPGRTCTPSNAFSNYFRPTDPDAMKYRTVFAPGEVWSTNKKNGYRERL